MNLDIDLQDLDLTPKSQNTQVSWAQKGPPLTMESDIKSLELRSSNMILQDIISFLAE